MNKYKCVIFDCDGVLVDSETISNRILTEMANENGANIDLEYAMNNFKGNSFKGCLKLIENLISKPLPKTFEKAFRKRTFGAFKKDIKPIEGVKDVLENLDIPYCVASSGPEKKIKLNLEVTGLLGYFEDNHIFSCFSIKKWKPEPDIFLHAAKTMGFKPSECLVIEDSLLGVEAARRGGFDVFGFTAHDYKHELKNHATFTFKHMNQLLTLI
ncbi:MAG: HAD family hydrolase [Flavobacteriaceae bacterium]|nr:HAD family hydrolase [Flavobacteriaceae bacterium]